MFHTRKGRRRAVRAMTRNNLMVRGIAVRDRLALEEAETAFDRIRARGDIDDVFRRSAPDTRKARA